MARDVNEILVNICKNQGQMTHQAALQYVKGRLIFSFVS